MPKLNKREIRVRRSCLKSNLRIERVKLREAVQSIREDLRFARGSVDEADEAEIRLGISHINEAMECLKLAG